MLKGNKGEWSEVYTLIKLLAEKNLQVGDKDLNKIQDLLYPIIKILRDESNGIYEYVVEDKIDTIRVIENGESLFSISVYDFKVHSEILLKKIKTNKFTTFGVPELEAFLTKIKCSTLKAKSSHKTDIRIVVHDLKTNMQPELGFSIKSQLGNPSTLLNAGKSTNFIYKIKIPLTDSKMEEINSIQGARKIKARIKRLIDAGTELKFCKTENNVFGNNLILIDSLLHAILAEIVKDFYSTHCSNMAELVAHIETLNPLNYDTTSDHKYYEYKVKKFLTAIAVGMMPATVWEGIHDATGGYLVVKSNGEIRAYHLYNVNEFEDYLFYNTKLDTASSTRHAFGKVYELGGEYFFKLNLQIRFIK